MSPTQIAISKFQRRHSDRLHVRLALPGERKGARMVAAVLVTIAAAALFYFIARAV